MYPRTDRTSLDRKRSAPSVKIRGFTIDRYNRYWQVTDPTGCLICLTVYKRGAKEVIRRLTA